MSKKKKKDKKSPVSVICSALGTVLLVSLVLVCLPITATRLFGYDAYSVVSGSMEPAIPTGSLVYVQEAAPEDMEKDDVIAFYGAKDSNAIITHRVVENKVVMGEFITKGDANKTEDMNPVPYSNFIGKVVYSIPVLGSIAEALTSTMGKIIAGGVIAAALILEVIASAVRRRE